MNELYKALGHQSPIGQSPIGMINQIRRDPMSVLSRAGLSMPSGLNDPTSIIQHLMQTGQITQAQYDRAVRMAGSLMPR